MSLCRYVSKSLQENSRNWSLLTLRIKVRKNASVLDTFNHIRTRQGWKGGGGMAGLGLYRKHREKENSKICVHIFTACELTIHVAAIPLKLSSVYSIFEITQV
jgi:hypothetical protein